MTSPVVLMDGGMGTALRMKFPEKLTRDPLWSARMLLSEEGANEVVNMHGEFVTAGSQMITTNNYACVPLYLDRAEGLDLETMNKLSVSLCERAISHFADKPVKIAVSLPPLRQSYSTGEDGRCRTTDLDTYNSIVRATSHRADLYIVETVSTAWAAVAPVTAASPTGKKTLVAYSVCDKGTHFGGLRSGDTLATAMGMLAAQKAVPYGVLFNCSSQDSITDAVQNLYGGIKAKTTPFPVHAGGAYANALKPIPVGWNHHRDGPPGDLNVTEAEYAATIDSWLKSADEANADITNDADKAPLMVGGCCGILPKHIEYLDKHLSGRNRSLARW